MSRTRLLNRRTRIVNFRLTEHEYTQIQAACSERYGNCLSEFARTAVLAYAQGAPAPGPALERRLLALEEKISLLGRLLPAGANARS